VLKKIDLHSDVPSCCTGYIKSCNSIDKNGDNCYEEVKKLKVRSTVHEIQKSINQVGSAWSRSVHGIHMRWEGMEDGEGADGGNGGVCERRTGHKI